MSFLKKLFGLGGGGSPAAPAETVQKTVDYNGFSIRATPYKEQGQYQLCGIIAKEVDGTLKEHRFVRADRMASLEDIVEMTIRKGQQMIDQQGERLLR